MKNIIVTGGYGFIGSNWIRKNIDQYNILNIDSLEIGSNPLNLLDIKERKNYNELIVDITNEHLDLLIGAIMPVPDAIVHFAAESHVDRSIEAPLKFIKTNVIGTTNMLNILLNTNPKGRFVHVSTDEVFGHLEMDDTPFNETTPYAPRSPYSASKASSDHVVRSYHETYGLDVCISNCVNNFGPRQYPEKLIPVVIKNALNGVRIPVYGDGKNRREWIHVDDHNTAITSILMNGLSGETYCIGSGDEYSNIDLVNMICDILDKVAPKHTTYKEQIMYVEDRKGHDKRYAINSSKIREQLGWVCEYEFTDALKKTVEWYISEFSE
jgi:dTDP-glucose 4,6-dehydratase